MRKLNEQISNRTRDGRISDIRKKGIEDSIVSPLIIFFQEEFKSNPRETVEKINDDKFMKSKGWFRVFHEGYGDGVCDPKKKLVVGFVVDDQDSVYDCYKYNPKAWKRAMSRSDWDKILDGDNGGDEEIELYESSNSIKSCAVRLSDIKEFIRLFESNPNQLEKTNIEDIQKKSDFLRTVNIHRLFEILEWPVDIFPNCVDEDGDYQTPPVYLSIELSDNYIVFCPYESYGFYLVFERVNGSYMKMYYSLRLHGDENLVSVYEDCSKSEATKQTKFNPFFGVNFNIGPNFNLVENRYWTQSGFNVFETMKILQFIYAFVSGLGNEPSDDALKLWDMRAHSTVLKNLCRRENWIESVLKDMPSENWIEISEKIYKTMAPKFIPLIKKVHQEVLENMKLEGDWIECENFDSFK